MISYINDQVEWFGQNWNRFWFTPTNGENLLRLRLLICSAAALWFAISITNNQWWFGAAGWNADDLARSLNVATEGTWPGRFRVSPLWSSSQPLFFQIWACAGGLVAVLAAVGIGGRAAMFVLFLLTLFLAQRLTWSTGAFEPALTAMLGYMVIDPGPSLVRRPDLAEHRRWSATLTTRLLQVHGWLLIVAALAGQVSSAAWWRGEAVWWMAVAGKSNLFAPEFLRGHLLAVNALTHAISICTLTAVLTLWSTRLRPIGLLCGCALGVAYALINDQILYGCLLTALLLGSFRRCRPKR